MSASHSSFQKIAIVGSGAVGSYYGVLLARSGKETHFLMRSDLAHVKTHGLEIRSQGESFTLSKPLIHASTNTIGPCDLVIIALKATDNDVLTDLIPPLLGPHTAILTLQNGLGNEAFLASHFGQERILGGLCFVCLNRTAPGLVEHFSQGMIALGEFERPPAERTHRLVADFQNAGINCRLMDDLNLARWRKLVWNVPFNGLAIVGGGVDVSTILNAPSLAHLTRLLMTEIIGIAKQLGHAIPLTFIDQQLEATLGMGPYKPSSLLDFLSGKRVEVEAIWGEALRQGKAANAECRHLEMLYHLLKAQCPAQV